MDLEQLRCFVVTAEELHFGRAAQKLGILPAALGRHIKLLEEELATRLIDRTTRSVTLTATELFFWTEREPCSPTPLTLKRNSGQVDESNP